MIKRVRDKKQTHVQSENATIHARRRFGHGTKIKALSCLKKLPHGSFLYLEVFKVPWVRKTRLVYHFLLG